MFAPKPADLHAKLQVEYRIPLALIEKKQAGVGHMRQSISKYVTRADLNGCLRDFEALAKAELYIMGAKQYAEKLAMLMTACPQLVKKKESLTPDVQEALDFCYAAVGINKQKDLLVILQSFKRYHNQMAVFDLPIPVKVYFDAVIPPRTEIANIIYHKCQSLGITKEFAGCVFQTDPMYYAAWNEVLKMNAPPPPPLSFETTRVAYNGAAYIPQPIPPVPEMNPPFSPPQGGESIQYPDMDLFQSVNPQPVNKPF